MIYAADAAALAVLEVRVHLDLTPDLLPDDYRLLAIDCDGASIETIDGTPSDAAEFGDIWLSEMRSALLKVPSVIVPESCNLLINPLHPEATKIGLLHDRPFAFEKRLCAPNWP